MEEGIHRTKDIRDFVKTFWRRRYHFALPSLGVSGAALIVALLLPPVYRATTTRFLKEEQEQVKEQIAQLEKQMAAYKGVHMGELPEQLPVNLETLRRIEQAVDRIDQESKTVQERKIYLEGQLAGIDSHLPWMTRNGQRVPTPRERLSLLKMDLINLQSSRSPTHPDVVRTRKEIAGLEQEVDGKGDSEGLEEQRKRLEERKADLSTLLGKLREEHPDVIRTRKEIRELEREVEAMQETGLSAADEEEQDNPAYINLQTQIAVADLEINSLKEEKEKVKEQMGLLQARIERTPGVEEGLLRLLRDKENANRNYQTLMPRYMEARVSENLEKEQKAERFEITDPAVLPERPYKPNRLAIALLGLILSLGTGVGSVGLAEHLDGSFRDTRALAAFTGLPVLVHLSRIVTAEEVRRQRRRLIYGGVAGLLLLLILAVVHFFVIELDVLFARRLRSMDKRWPF